LSIDVASSMHHRGSTLENSAKRTSGRGLANIQGASESPPSRQSDGHYSRKSDIHISITHHNTDCSSVASDRRIIWRGHNPLATHRDPAPEINSCACPCGAPLIRCDTARGELGIADQAASRVYLACAREASRGIPIPSVVDAVAGDGLDVGARPFDERAAELLTCASILVAIASPLNRFHETCRRDLEIAQHRQRRALWPSTITREATAASTHRPATGAMFLVLSRFH
jgi:hypothetical protein